MVDSADISAEPPAPHPVQEGGHACGCGHHAGASSILVGFEVPLPREAAGCGCRSRAPWRRLHALCGAGFALFAVAHLVLVTRGLSPQRYQILAAAMAALKTQVIPLEWLLWGLPAVLAASGLYLLAHAGLAFGVKRCNRGGKLRYAVQRWSAIVLISFLAFHLTQSLHTFDPARAFASTRAMVGASPGAACLTVLGLAALSYHAANGLTTAWVFWKLPGDGPWGWRGLLAAAAGITLAALGGLACWIYLPVR
jgi:succinate dehydrogenase/fumarate reductase cytochrome b subunit